MGRRGTFLTRAFTLSFLGGVLLAVLAISFYPLPANLRYRSIISVEPDSGRREDFVIRWPQDRIPLPRDDRRAPSPPGAAGSAVLEDSAGQRTSVELFRLRNTDGDVIGVASRMALAGGDVATRGGSVSNWTLVVPSRGTLFLTQVDATDVTLRTQDGPAGVVNIAREDTASFWAGGPRFQVTAGPAGAGKVLRGTGEFDGLGGSYRENWELEEIGAEGVTRGRIVLSTVTARGE